MRRTLLHAALLLVASAFILTACQSSSPPRSSASQNTVISPALFSGASINDWPMFGYDPGHTGYVDPLVHPGNIQGNVAWQHMFGPIFSSPVAGLGMLFIASTDGYLNALQQSTGDLVWRSQIGDYLSDATPALEGQALFVAVRRSQVEALNARTSHLYWTYNISEKIQAPPMIAGKRLLVASQTSLWALDTASGKLLWKFHHGAVAWPTTASPALIGNTIYVGLGTGSQIWALSLIDGHVLWSFDTKDRITSSITADTSSVYVATWHGGVFALDRTNGALRWSYTLNTIKGSSVIDGIAGSMALAPGYLCFGDYRGSIYCLNTAKGVPVWSYPTGAQVLATPIIASGQVYIGSSDGYFYALDLRSGRPTWRYATGEIRNAALLSNQHLYVGSISGAFYAFT